MSGMRVAVTFGNETRAVDPMKRRCARSALSRCAIRSRSIRWMAFCSAAAPTSIRRAMASTNAGSDEVDDARDELEMRLLREALAADVPVLAICRGLQVLQRGLRRHADPAFGSSTHVHRQKPKDAEPGKHPAAHRIWVGPNTRLAEIIGAGGHEVNSRHHQAIETGWATA